jgi:hypothetical protein
MWADSPHAQSKQSAIQQLADKSQQEKIYAF